MRSAKAVVSENLARYGKTGPNMSYGGSQSAHTLTSLKRWSVANAELPAVSQIKSIHVYDFDNTLFSSPLPNPQLWHGSTIGHLQSETHFANGGWWHDPNILSATGNGLEEEEARGWKGWWNENILHLVKLSMKQKDAVTVLLTGRSEAGFAELIKRMVASQKLEFDLIGLKPEVGPNGQRFSSTAVFKNNFFEDLVLTYDQADDLRVYEDRPKHVKTFRDYFEDMNRRLQSGQYAPRKPINAEVIQVYEGATLLDPVTETAEVQRMINSHNLALRNPSLGRFKGTRHYMRIKRTIIYTGYLISQDDSKRIIDEVLNSLLPNGLAESNDIKYMANNILIAPRPAPHSVLDKVGGIGKKVKWQITGTSVLENRVFAARVAPIPSNEQIYSENSVPLIVLAVRKGARPVEASRITNWQPVPSSQALRFDTVVGEKAILRIEDDERGGAPSAPKNPKKRYAQDQYEDGYSQPTHHDSWDKSSHGFHPYQRPTGENRGSYDDSNTRRGAYRGRGRGNGRGRGYATRGARGRGRGGRGDSSSNPHYKSLDDYSNGYDGPQDSKGGNHNNSGYSMDY
ncbi:hypothetical protein N7454_010469 [Penicillium verhagenii]|nr:hypothetical protein N7454_010469 [Penicillium verhagenii]